MSRPLTLALLAVAMLAGCRPENAPKGARATEAPIVPREAILAGVPRLENSVVHDTTGTVEAERMRVRVVRPMAEVVVFFQDTLPKLGWTIRSTQTDSSRVLLYAQKDHAILWADIHTVPRFPIITEYILISGSGASATTAPPRPAMLDSVPQGTSKRP